MDSSERATLPDTSLEVARRIDQRIKPWLWALVLGLAFGAIGTLAIVTDVDGAGELADAMLGYAIYSFAFGAVFGALAAYAARNVVKALRC